MCVAAESAQERQVLDGDAFTLWPSGALQFWRNFALGYGCEGLLEPFLSLFLCDDADCVWWVYMRECVGVGSCVIAMCVCVYLQAASSA